MRTLFAAAALAATLFGAYALPAFAADAPAPMPVRIMGTIQTVDGDAVTVKNADGSMVTFNVAPMGNVISNQPMDVKKITDKHLIALDTTVKDGKTTVTQLHTQFNTRGANAAPTRVLNSDKNTTRHLGKVVKATPTANGMMIEVEHERKIGPNLVIEVTNKIPLLYHNQEETKAALKPGVMVMTNATKGKDGKLSAGFVTVEAGGHKPIQIPD